MAFDATVQTGGGTPGPTNLAQAEAKIAGLERKVAKQREHLEAAELELEAAKGELEGANAADVLRREKEAKVAGAGGAN